MGTLRLEEAKSRNAYDSERGQQENTMSKHAFFFAPCADKYVDGAACRIDTRACQASLIATCHLYTATAKWGKKAFYEGITEARGFRVPQTRKQVTQDNKPRGPK